MRIMPCNANVLLFAAYFMKKICVAVISTFYIDNLYRKDSVINGIGHQPKQFVGIGSAKRNFVWHVLRSLARPFRLPLGGCLQITRRCM